ncbi:MAG TPA: class I SAM-dependent methyltransferase [Nitrososphaeraceae archaeon]
MIQEDSARNFPDWDTLYKNQKVQKMPWFNENLDADLEEELEKRRIRTGMILDLGTGPATQAVQLCRRGLSVTGSDISSAAIQRAKKTYVKDFSNIRFVVDDILDSKFANDEFNYIFDRGCFHVMPPEMRSTYVGEIKRILDKNGFLFLKCFSTKEQREEGPYKFSEADIKKIFGRKFSIASIKEAVYQGTLNPLPKALFVVMRKRSKNHNPEHDI